MQKGQYLLTATYICVTVTLRSPSRTTMSSKIKPLMERLRDGESVIAAEGYLHHFERLGYMQACGWCPHVVLEQPHIVKNAYQDYVHAGSDVVVAFTYYAHREHLRLYDIEDKVELINRTALQLAREVADDTGTLLAGNICNTNIYHPDSPERDPEIKAMFKEMIEWSLDYNVDFIIGETFWYFGEAMLALEAIKEYGKGVATVIMLAPYCATTKGGEVVTCDGILITEACRKLKEAGADVVGLNCGRGPSTLMPLMREIRKVCEGPLAALPLPLRTTEEEPTLFLLTDPLTGKKILSDDMDIKSCSREDIKQFGKECKELGIHYLGICCGNRPSYTRALAESVGRNPPASRFTINLSKHMAYGTDPRVKKNVATDNLKLLYNKVEN